MLLKIFPLRFVLILIGICALAVLLPGQAEGRVWYVDDNGGQDYTKIQSAVDASEDGDTIRVFEGTYYENVIVNKTVSLVGNGSAKTTIDGDGVRDDVVRIMANWCNVSGFEVINGFSAGIEVEADNITITSNTISNNDNGIAISRSSNTTITDNTISSNNEGGIESIFSHDITITDNDISNNDYGIYLLGSSDCTISNSTCSENIDYGIYLWSSSDCIISSNTCENNDIGIYFKDSSDCTISGNTISSNNDYGISLGGSNDCTIKNNTCSENTKIGISSWGSNDCTISNNTCSENNDGISLRESNGCTITNNTCSNNDGTGIRLGGSNNTITSNTISNSEYGISLGGSNNAIIGNTISNNGKGISSSRILDTAITGNIISNNGKGIYFSRPDSNTTVHSNKIFNNTDFGIYVSDPENKISRTINATDNWWGRDSGPYHPSENPGGEGDAVSNGVEFLPWMDEEGDKVYTPSKVKDEEDTSISGLSILLFLLIIIILCLLVVVVRLPDKVFRGPETSPNKENEPSDKENKSPPHLPQRINICPHCGGEFELASQRRPVRFRCHFCGKEIEFK